MNDNDPRVIGKQLLNQIKKYAADAGHGCEVNDECENITVGFSCKQCLKKLCNTHLYFTYSEVKLIPVCPSCIVKNHPDIFDTYEASDSDEYDDEEEYDEVSSEDDVIDAEFE